MHPSTTQHLTRASPGVSPQDPTWCLPDPTAPRPLRLSEQCAHPSARLRASVPSCSCRTVNGHGYVCHAASGASPKQGVTPTPAPHARRGPDPRAGARLEAPRTTYKRMGRAGRRGPGEEGQTCVLARWYRAWTVTHHRCDHPNRCRVL